MPNIKATPIEITKEERTELEQRVRQSKTSQRDVLRAQIILKAAEGFGNEDIAEELGCQRLTVRKWRNRFLQKRIDGLNDLPRSGRPSLFSPRRTS